MGVCHLLLSKKGGPPPILRAPECTKSLIFPGFSNDFGGNRGPKTAKTGALRAPVFGLGQDFLRITMSRPSLGNKILARACNNAEGEGEASSQQPPPART